MELAIRFPLFLYGIDPKSSRSMLPCLLLLNHNNNSNCLVLLHATLKKTVLSDRRVLMAVWAAQPEKNWRVWSNRRVWCLFGSSLSQETYNFFLCLL
ncbi:hypothetical protein PoB_001412500 [Plakobranchus ocellatus]|uniref:Uncharacterized protein n=1 Tax=Plakobranchus ocellatus TaxID=259542 RepID=A0AAV3YWN0_9GAST|nr:hypothetical protein PoB_001412500 [Plakobranchus ocellatus]